MVLEQADNHTQKENNKDLEVILHAKINPKWIH